MKKWIVKLLTRWGKLTFVTYKYPFGFDQVTEIWFLNELIERITWSRLELMTKTDIRK